jgi:hypothetical protein
VFLNYSTSCGFPEEAATHGDEVLGAQILLLTSAGQMEVSCLRAEGVFSPGRVTTIYHPFISGVADMMMSRIVPT